MQARSNIVARLKDPNQQAYYAPTDPGMRVSYHPVSAGVYQLYIFGPIEHASQFVDHLEVMSMATENDVVVLNLSTPGGSISATDTLIQGMRECEGRVIVKATGDVHSAGTIILLNADEFILSENFQALVHNGGTGTMGKYSDWKLEAEHTAKYMDRVLRNTYKNFLTDDELDALIAGKDFWFFAEEFVERWKRREAAEHPEMSTTAV